MYADDISHLIETKMGCSHETKGNNSANDACNLSAHTCTRMHAHSRVLRAQVHTDCAALQTEHMQTGGS